MLNAANPSNQPSPSPAPRGGRVFLLSPANFSGARAKMLLRKEASFDLAVRVRDAGAPLGEIFSFISRLYFRGKLAYAQTFAHRGDPAVSAVQIITASRGLLPPDTFLSARELLEMSRVPIHISDTNYRSPLDRDALRLAAQIGSDCEVVLLGSIATPKYIAPLLEIFGARLLFPADFVGRGDMSRGGLLLSAAQDGVPLRYAAIANAVRHGPRPPKLSPQRARKRAPKRAPKPGKVRSHPRTRS
jgi:hypothetical protein